MGFGGGLVGVDLLTLVAVCSGGSASTGVFVMFADFEVRTVSVEWRCGGSLRLATASLRHRFVHTRPGVSLYQNVAQQHSASDLTEFLCVCYRSVFKPLVALCARWCSGTVSLNTRFVTHTFGILAFI